MRRFVHPQQHSDRNSTGPRLVEYGRRLHLMTECINRYLDHKGRCNEERHEAMVAAANFCLNYPETFRVDFLSRLHAPRALIGSIDRPRPKQTAFTDLLANRPGECVFLLRDAFGCMQGYQNKTGRGFGITVNRPLLCPQESDYFEFLDLTYLALQRSNSYEEFQRNYYQGFESLLVLRPHLDATAREISRYVKLRCSSQELTFVDTGSQFTFALFCQASLRRFGGRGLKLDVYTYSAYPWLWKVFGGRFFCAEQQSVVQLEQEGARLFETTLTNRATGALVGLAIGDALGFSAAGVEIHDIPNYVPESRITGFTSSPSHPYFSNLRPGQFTSNTIFALLMAWHLTQNGGFDKTAFVETLTSVGRMVLAAPTKWRWIGPTTYRALMALIDPSCHSRGQHRTQSCAAAYRSVPLGLFYSPMARMLPREATALIVASARVTHNSEISAAGAVFVATLISDLVLGVAPRTAVSAAVRTLRSTVSTRPLIAKLDLALETSAILPIGKARQIFGTSSQIDQTLPLSVFCFLSSALNFKQAVLDAANSFRIDDDAERNRLAVLSPEAAMQQANGGNTDGIAALAGAFSGAYLGFTEVPLELQEVEGLVNLQGLAKALIAAQISDLRTVGLDEQNRLWLSHLFGGVGAHKSGRSIA